MFKVGDIITHSSENHRVDYHVYDVLPSGMHLRWKRDELSKEAFVRAEYYHFYTKKITPIDWTKPLQWTGSHPRPVQLIGKHGDTYVVQTGERVPFFEAFTADGRYAHQASLVYISNAPPPPVWPQKRYFVTWCGFAGEPNVSGQQHTRHTAEAFAERLRVKGNTDINIQEVTFGPSRT
jgi:hypothetical protein